jgi:hypothetical protein
MAFAHVMMIPLLVGGQLHSLDHTAPPMALRIGSSAADDKNDGFICTTLCPGSFCPNSCSDGGGQEPDRGDTRTQQHSQDSDGPNTFDASRGVKPAEDKK